MVVALVTERGGPTSHTAIIARQLGIPCVVGVAGLRRRPRPARRVLVDGTTGEVDRRPGRRRVAAARVAAGDARPARRSRRGPAPGRTADGTPVKLLANVADGASARAAAPGPVEGVGLFRTELCFLDRKDEPSVEEQAEHLRRGARRLRPTSATSWSAPSTPGSDKPIAFATHEGEENPALGVRGLRLSFGNPGLLERQLDGIALAAAAHRHRDLGDGADGRHRRRGGRRSPRRSARAASRPGVMVEIPSAALLAHRMLEVVDFLSIGTNDLTQYTMAADRMATDLAHLTDAWQPAVLQLIAITAEAGRQAGKPVGVCGEAAADPLLATALVGMGITSLSMAPAAVRPVGAQLAGSPMDTCEQRRRGRARRRRPATARAAVRAVLDSDARSVWRADPTDPTRRTGGAHAGRTVTGTPLSAALPLTSSSAGSVRSLIETPGTVAAWRSRMPGRARGRSRGGG